VTRLALPFPEPTACIWCKCGFTDGPLLEWQLCSESCANADREKRYQKRKPAGDFNPADQDWADWLEERRQAGREVRLQAAMVARWSAHREGKAIADHLWLELAEADLGHHGGREIARRIGELVDLYAARASRHPDAALLRPEELRRKLWAFVPVGRRVGGAPCH